MRTGLMVDCNCDLPRDYIDKHRIMVLPVKIRADGQQFEDGRVQKLMLDFYRQHIGDKAHDAETIPPTVEQIRDLYLNKVVLDFDYVLCETVMSTRSLVYENATKASYAILKDYHKVRDKNGVDGHFALRIINSQTIFAGQAALAAETVRLIDSGMLPNEIREKIEKLTDDAYGYAVPHDLFYLRARARKKGDKSVGWLGAALGSALNIKPVIRAHKGNTEVVAKMRGYENAVQRLFKQTARLIQEDKLLAPYVCVSYAGDPAQVLHFPGFSEMKLAAIAKDFEVLLAITSMSAGINLGPGALTIGFLAKPHIIDT